MEENNSQNSANRTDVYAIIKAIWNRRKLLYKVFPVVFVLSCLYIFSIPRFYTAEVKLAPEADASGTSSQLGALASSFGVDFADFQTSDAITPLLYPDLIEDNAFIYSLLSTQVKNQDGNIQTSYYDYLKKYQKSAWWTYSISWIKKLFSTSEDKGESKDDFDPYYVSKDVDAIYNKARQDIKISVDKKTGVITINVTAQDALVAKLLGDSIMNNLQSFITKYRTNKARIDYEYYKELTDSTWREYERVRRKYAEMSDAYTNIKRLSAIQKVEDVANDMEIKFRAYTNLNTQLEAAKAKVQERTPAFTIIKGASVPVKPSGPKRMSFVLSMLFLATVCTSLYVMWSIVKPEKK